MKRFILILSVLVVSIFSFSGSAQTLDPAESTYRVFFQVTEGNIRFTGCVNLGGTCFSPEESVVQDCFVGGQWIPCGWE